MAAKTVNPDAAAALSAFGPARSTVSGTPLAPEELRRIDGLPLSLVLSSPARAHPGGSPG